jgi:hypothetical protein
MIDSRTQSLAVCAIIAGVSLASFAARGADMATKVPPPRGCAQAVDGTNGKLGGFGGAFGNKSYYAGEGALAVPLGCEWGAQLDLTGGPRRVCSAPMATSPTGIDSAASTPATSDRKQKLFRTVDGAGGSPASNSAIRDPAP